MKILEVEQGSRAWHEARARHFTASEAPAMMGASKYQTRNELLQLKRTGIAPEVSDMQQRIFNQGHAAEAGARPIAERIVGEELYPATAESDDHPELLASFDGITMLEGVTWEHKLYTESLATQIKSGDLEPHYFWQLEQQLLVSGAERCLFQCSDGTEENEAHMWYESVPGRAEQLLAGWKQFAEDLESYEHREAAPEAKAAPTLDLPVVSVQISGELAIVDNFGAFETALREFVDHRLITKPQTDQDFADLEGQIKVLKKAEGALDAAEAQLLSQVSTVDQLKRTKDLLHKLARDNRLRAEKLVKSEKEARKLEILNGAKHAMTDHLAKLSTRLRVVSMPFIDVDFAGAMKGKRTLSSLQSAADDELARAKIEANALADTASANLRTLNTMASKHTFLFHDLQVIAWKPNDDFTALVKARIADHKEAEAARLEAERERIHQEEAAKLEAQKQVSPMQAVEQPAPRFGPPTMPKREADGSIQETHVTITKREYDELCSARDMLDALKAAGVDNWEGYAEAMREVA